MNYFFAGTLCPATAFALTAGTDWTEVLWLLSALVGQVGQVEEIGTTGPLTVIAPIGPWIFADFARSR